MVMLLHPSLCQLICLDCLIQSIRWKVAHPSRLRQEREEGAVPLCVQRQLGRVRCYATNFLLPLLKFSV